MRGTLNEGEPAARHHNSQKDSGRMDEAKTCSATTPALPSLGCVSLLFSSLSLSLSLSLSSIPATIPGTAMLIPFFLSFFLLNDFCFISQFVYQLIHRF